MLNSPSYKFTGGYVMDVINVSGLIKRYGKSEVLREVSFKVDEGQIHGYLGPNGSGKTTTIKVLLDLTRRDGGTVEIYGCDPMRDRREALKHIGYVPEVISLPKFMTGLDFLTFSGMMAGMSKSEARARAKELLDVFNLSSVANKKIGKYSKGMMQKISIANALLNYPDLLILDEPTTGMDPISRIELRENLIKINKEENTTIFLSSHLLEEVEKICTHLTLINKGTILYSGTLDELLKKTGDRNTVVIKLESPIPGLVERIKELSFVKEIKSEDTTLRIIMNEDKRGDLSRVITEMGGVIVEMKIKQMDLETAFKKLISSENIENSVS
ncbi:MAG: ABC transporter ATP-binding protein [Thermoprotei archaeon]|nr:MAG: ABC transporter ATP-binding protein [Thermoprotei archaeon]